LGRYCHTGLFAVAHDASDRRLTRGLFAVMQHLERNDQTRVV
jgi:hypothetical protein